jgi:DNA-binding PadR family transcriptional regulator
MTTPTPTTTTYALLALLALRPWTGYELTRQARRSLHYAWPRSEANLYSEQKQLVRLGWATVTKEARGRRTRNRYEITAKGRRALRAWMRTEPDTPRLEIEGIVRMFFADQGDVEDLAQAIRTTGALAGDAIAEVCGLVEDYFETGGPFPERLHVIAMAADLVTDLLSRIETFAQEAVDEVERWKTTKGQGMTPAARARLQAILARGGRTEPGRTRVRSARNT